MLYHCMPDPCPVDSDLEGSCLPLPGHATSLTVDSGLVLARIHVSSHVLLIAVLEAFSGTQLMLMILT